MTARPSVRLSLLLLPVVVILAGLVGWRIQASAPPDPEAQAALLLPILQGLYRGFAEKEETAIYAALSQVATGEALHQLYLQRRQGLVTAHDQAATVAINQVTLEAIETLPGSTSKALALRAVWQVRGTVEHFGHLHDRANRYAGRLDLRATPEGWRLQGLSIDREEPIDTQSNYAE